MGMLAWVMMGLALWHFTIWLPDRFWGGIVGAFVGALIGAVVFGLIVNGGAIPGEHATDPPLAPPRGSGPSRARSSVWPRCISRASVVSASTAPASPDCLGASSATPSRFRRTSRLGSPAMAEPRLEVPACDMSAALALERELA